MNASHSEKTYKIFVNGTGVEEAREVLTYDDVVALAFPTRDPNTIFIVTFSHGREPKQGELVAGQQVEIKQNTEFDVVDAGRS